MQWEHGSGGIMGTGNPQDFKADIPGQYWKILFGSVDSSPDSFGFVGIQSMYVFYILLIHLLFPR